MHNTFRSNKKPLSDLIGPSIFMLLCIVVYYLQDNLYLHKDVAIITHAATQLLQGQTYAHDIFDPNPPIIFYLHWIPIVLAKLTGLSILPIFRGYVIVLSIVAIQWSLQLFNKLCIFNRLPLHKNNYSILAGGLIYILLFLPADAFGQREHFYVILTLPYLFLAACRLHAIQIKGVFTIAIGCMAGIGFAIKPVFLPMLGLIDLFFIYQTRRILGWLRLESLCCLTILAGYALMVFWLYPSYFQIILPFWKPYYLGIIKHWTIVIDNLSVIWCCSAIGVYFLTRPHTLLKSIIVISIFGNIIAYLIPQVNWYYHLYPALAMSCLYFILHFSELVTTIQDKDDFLLTCTMACVILLIPVGESSMRTYHAVTYFHDNNSEKQLLALLNQYPNQNHYMFFSMTHTLYDLELYSQAKQVGCLSFCHWEYTRLKPYSIHYINTIRAYALQLITHDLNAKKPGFVIIDNPSTQRYLGQKIDFSTEYKRDPEFQKAWNHYTYLTSIYPYDVYRRSV